MKAAGNTLVKGIWVTLLLMALVFTIVNIVLVNPELIALGIFILMVGTMLYMFLSFNDDFKERSKAADTAFAEIAAQQDREIQNIYRNSFGCAYMNLGDSTPLASHNVITHVPRRAPPPPPPPPPTPSAPPPAPALADVQTGYPVDKSVQQSSVADAGRGTASLFPKNTSAQRTGWRSF